MFRFAFLFAGVFGFVASWHGGNSRVLASASGAVKTTIEVCRREKRHCITFAGKCRNCTYENDGAHAVLNA
jgi:hypothetical protein